MNSLIEGLILGVTLALFFGFGPAFFALIQTGLHRGFKKGFFLALGVFFNDLTVVSLSIVGAHAIMSNMQKHQLLGIIGGLILILFGIASFRQKIQVAGPDEEEELNINEPHALMFILKGFLLNVANPFVWLFWPTVVLGVAAPFMNETRDMVQFFAGTLFVVFLSDITKVFLASRIKNYITDRFLFLVNRIAGIGLFLFGIVLIIRTLFLPGIF